MTLLACHTPDDDVRVIGRVIIDPTTFHAIDGGADKTLCGVLPGVIYANVEFAHVMTVARDVCCSTCLSQTLWAEATGAANE